MAAVPTPERVREILEILDELLAPTHVHAEVHLDWTDRIRVMCGRVLHVDVDIVPGVPATSRTLVESIPWPWKRTAGGYSIQGEHHHEPDSEA